MKSDSQVQKDILAELKWEPSVNAAEIGVEVKDGIVTLAGHVNSFSEKWSAERAAQRIVGVKALAVEMDVKLSGSSKSTDADIARAAEAALGWMSLVPKDSVRIMVENGWITLTGQVDWEFQRLAAVGGIRDMMGVTGVSEQISLKTRVCGDTVKADIEATLKRRAQDDSQKIFVEVRGDEVILSGVVHSWSERDLAIHAAWGSPGVTNVINSISVLH